VALVGEGPDQADLAGHVAALEPQGGADDQDVDAEATDQLGGLAVDAAVDVDLAAVQLVRQVLARFEELRPRDVGHERLPAEARLDGHDHHDVQQPLVRREGGQVRLRLDAQAGGASSGPDRAERGLDVLLDLDVDRDRVAAGVEVLLDVAGRVGDHQVRVERQSGPAPEGLDGLRPEREIRHEVAVHHIEMDAIGALPLGAGHGVGEVPEVGVEDAGGDAGARRRRRLGERRDLALHPSTPAGTGSSLRWPWRARALAVSRSCRRRATAGAAGAPARSAASWPQAAPISTPRLRRIVIGMPAALSRAANCSMTGIGLARHGVWATGFIGMRLTWARSPRSRVASASASASVSFTPPIIVIS